MSRRILLVVDSLFPLGDAYQLKILAEGLSSKHQVCICVTGSTDPKDRSSFTSSDVPVHFLASDQKLKHRTQAAKIQTGFRLRKRIQAFQPNIVHAFGQRSTHIAAATLLKNDQPKLYSSVLSKWKPHTTPTKRFEGCLVSRVDHFFVAHECLRNELQALGVSDQKSSVVSNGIKVGDSGESKVDSRDRQRGRGLLIQETGLDSTAFIAVTSANLEPVTRLKDLIWATDLLSCVRDDVHLVILGKGSQNHGLLNFASCTEAADHIHFAGLPTTALEMLGGADVYWNSHLQTPLPSGVLAAMNFGVPVISVYGPETEQMIRHQETGFAVNFGARDEFARWTKFLIEKPDAAEQLSRQGRQHVREQFDSKANLLTIEKLYSDLDSQ